MILRFLPIIPARSLTGLSREAVSGKFGANLSETMRNAQRQAFVRTCRGRLASPVPLPNRIGKG